MNIRLTTAIAAGLTAVLLSGCSSDSKSGAASSASVSVSKTPTIDTSKMTPTDILKQATTVLKTVDSVRGNGKLKAEGVDVSLDYAYVKKDSAGTMGFSGASIELRSVDGTVYLKPSDDFWKLLAGPAADQVIKQYSGKWLKVSAADKSYSDFTAIANRESFIDDMFKASGTLSKGSDKTVNGVDCIAIVDNDKANPGTLYLAKTDLRPIQITSTAAGTLDFSYDGIQAPTAPPAGEVVAAPKLGG